MVKTAQVALVTGAWGMRSIGRATALRLAGGGANVVVSDIDRPVDRMSPDETRAEWRGIAAVVEEVNSLGVQGAAIRCDLTSEHEIESLIAETLNKFGRLDIVVNSARAMAPELPTLMDCSREHFELLVAVNLLAPHKISQLAARAMIDAGRGGSIINISSISGKQAMAGVWPPYAVTKAGLNMLTQMMAKEVAPFGIRVNAICPGWTDTSRVYVSEIRAAEKAGVSVEDFRARDLSEMAKVIPLRRVGAPEEIAEAAWFLASEASSYVTGQCICVDGGLVTG
jgi:3-oxoacyl-[acyl-carrier protein] reductase